MTVLKIKQRCQQLAQAMLLASLFLFVPSPSLADDINDYFLAVSLDRPSSVSRYLKKGIHPNALNPKTGETGLILALRENSIKSFYVLVDHPETDINFRLPHNRNTALMMAAWTGNIPAIRLLLKKGAWVNHDGWTALHYAAATGNAQAIKILIDARANTNVLSPTGITPLMMAARNNYKSAMQMLIKNGADAALEDMNQRDIADWANEFGHKELADELVPLVARVKKEKAIQREKMAQLLLKEMCTYLPLNPRTPPIAAVY